MSISKVELLNDTGITAGSYTAPTVTVTSDGRIASITSGGFGVPSGVITLWSGSVTSIPSGWVLCDGTNGTPDLRDKFVVGANTGTGDTVYPGLSVGATGGNADATLVAHNHTGTTNVAGNHSHGVPTGFGDDSPITSARNGSPETDISTTVAGNHSHTLAISFEGAPATDANLPPYYALAYIMKL